MQDMTFSGIMVPGLQNLRNGVKDRGLKDLKADWGTPWTRDRVIITGAGSSLEDAIPKINEMESDALIVANQSTALRLEEAGIHPDLVVLTDPQDIATELVQEFLKAQPEGLIPTRVVAATTTKMAMDPPKDALFFKNMASGKSDEALCWNAAVEMMDPRVQTYVLQVGSVVNASIIIVDYLMKEGLIRIPETRKHMFFAGVDFAEPRCKKARVRPNGKVVLESVAVDPQAFRFGGKLTTPALLAYYNDCKLIVNQLKTEKDPWKFGTIPWDTDSFLFDFILI